MKKGRPGSALVAVFVLVFCVFNEATVSLTMADGEPVLVPVGVVLDFKKMIGNMTRASLSLAMEDFYSSRRHFFTRLELDTRDSKGDVVEAYFQVDLMRKEHAVAIIGQWTTSQAEFMATLGCEKKMPMISFTATSPSISPSQLPYFVRTTLNDSSQVRCIADIIKLYGWREVVPIYEDSRYGSGIVPYISDIVEENRGRIPYRSVITSSATDDQIRVQLYKLKDGSTRVFILHATSTLGTRILRIAKELWMMDKGYVWILTDGIANVLETMDGASVEGMNGVLGVRPMINRSGKRYKNFAQRWKLRVQEAKGEKKNVYPSISNLRAYDTLWALATAVENLARSSLGLESVRPGVNSSELGVLHRSLSRSKLLNSIKQTSFHGLAGKFQLVNGEIQASAFQIINVKDGAVKEVGQWTEQGFFRNTSSNGKLIQLNSTDKLPILWPGRKTSAPKAWVAPMSGKMMKIGVPVKTGFDEFVKVERDNDGNPTRITGFSINIFDAVMEIMPYSVPYEYVPFENATHMSAGDYNELVNQVAIKAYDAVVGDVTILSERAEKVDFTLPYTESGWTMIVLEQDEGTIKWVFLKPFEPHLWIASFGFLLLTGFVVWEIERHTNPAYRGPTRQSVGRSLYFTLSTIAFAHRDKMESNFSRLTVVVWIFVAFILQSSFTASLSAALTIKKLEPAYTSVSQLLNAGEKVGCPQGAFICTAIEKLGFDKNKIIPYENPDEYADALSKGTRNGGVAAIFDEQPNLKIFFAKYCSGYTTAGPIFKADGFGFVFPKGSPILGYVSSAILSLAEGDEMAKIRKMWFNTQGSCDADASPFSSDGLPLKSFEALFWITAGVSTACFAFCLGRFFLSNRGTTKGLMEWARLFDKMASPVQETPGNTLRGDNPINPQTQQISPMQISQTRPFDQMASPVQEHEELLSGSSQVQETPGNTLRGDNPINPQTQQISPIEISQTRPFDQMASPVQEHEEPLSGSSQVQETPGNTLRGDNPINPQSPQISPMEISQTRPFDQMASPVQEHEEPLSGSSHQQETPGNTLRGDNPINPQSPQISPMEISQTRVWGSNMKSGSVRERISVRMRLVLNPINMFWTAENDSASPLLAS
ncbi:glutamate receptor 2.2-like isoform X2 [Wolffia australiana]